MFGVHVDELIWSPGWWGSCAVNLKPLLYMRLIYCYHGDGHTLTPMPVVWRLSQHVDNNVSGLCKHWFINTADGLSSVDAASHRSSSPTAGCIINLCYPASLLIHYFHFSAPLSRRRSSDLWALHFDLLDVALPWFVMAVCGHWSAVRRLSNLLIYSQYPRMKNLWMKKS